MKQNVLRLNVSVDNVVFVKVFHSVAYLFHHFASWSLLQRSFFNERIQISIKTRLEQEENMFLIWAEAVEVDDVGVAQETLNDYLSNHLIEVRVIELFLVDTLEAVDEVGPRMLN